MSRKASQAIAAFIIPVIFIVVFFIFVCEEDNGGTSYSTVNQISEEEGLRRLNDMVRDIDPQEAYVKAGAMLDIDDEGDLAATLPDDIDKFYPLNVEPYVSSNDVVVEIFSSTEKSGIDEPDNWLYIVANDFNQRNIKLTNGKTAKVSVRYIASGIGYLYIAAGKYIPDAFTPSNHLWIKMVEASGVSVTPISERLVGNTAGIVMRDQVYNELKENYPAVNVKAIIDAVAQGDIAMGYTNPFASSTGLNFLVTILARYAENDESRMLSPEVISSFEAFQQGVPYVAFTTIQMRDSVQRGGMLDAFVMEYQTYISTPELRSGYKFIEFGIRHDNPLYALGNISAEKREVLNELAKFIKQNNIREIANRYKFNQNLDYVSSYTVPSGDILIQAQQLWKEKKDAGRPIGAIFLSDISTSMDGYPLSNLKNALLEGSKFIDDTNFIGLVEFSTTVTKVLPISEFKTLQKSRFLQAIKNMEAEGNTAMFDGILVCLDMLLEFKKENPRAKLMLFVLTDGITNRGRSYQDAAPVIAALGIPIYTIGYGEDVDSGLLKDLSLLNEAANMSAMDEDVVYKIGSLLNAEM
jgi:Ca-activated chloride channel family protein